MIAATSRLSAIEAQHVEAVGVLGRAPLVAGVAVFLALGVRGDRVVVADRHGLHADAGGRGDVAGGSSVTGGGAGGRARVGARLAPFMLRLIPDGFRRTSSRR